MHFVFKKGENHPYDTTVRVERYRGFGGPGCPADILFETWLVFDTGALQRPRSGPGRLCSQQAISTENRLPAGPVFRVNRCIRFRQRLQFRKADNHEGNLLMRNDSSGIRTHGVQPQICQQSRGFLRRDRNPTVPHGDASSYRDDSDT